MAFMTSKSGRRFFSGLKAFQKWGDIDAALRSWAKNFRQRLDKAPASWKIFQKNISKSWHVFTTIKTPHNSPRFHQQLTTLLPPKNHKNPPKSAEPPSKTPPEKIIFPHATEPPAAPASPPSESVPAPPSNHRAPACTPPSEPPSHRSQTPPANHNPAAAPLNPD
jgi:hypothetical protein